MGYRTECKFCGDVREYEHRVDFSSTNCIECGSVAFGLIQYRWVEKAHEQCEGGAKKVDASVGDIPLGIVANRRTRYAGSSPAPHTKDRK